MVRPPIRVNISAIVGNAAIRTHPLGLAAYHRLYAGGKKVRPYKTLRFKTVINITEI